MGRYFKSIKKTRTKIKFILSEIKKNLQGTKGGGDEAKNQINNLGHKEEKKHSIITARRKNNLKKNQEDSIRTLCDIFKCTNI